MELVIHNASKECVEKIKQVLQEFDADLDIYEDEEYGDYTLSPEDEAKLQETLRLYREGKLKYLTLEESKARSEARLKRIREIRREIV